MKKLAIYVGRFNPIHAGHEAVINKMIADCGIDNCLLVIGSTNAPFSLRHFFSYKERREFIKTIFPKLKMVGIPDYGSDEDWLIALDDILLAAGFKSKDITFYGGCKEDILYFLNAKRKCKIMNRFDGTTPKISATEIRDSLIYDRPLDEFINKKIVPKIQMLFKEKWEKFKKM